MNQVELQLSERFANREQPALRLSELVAIIIGTPKCIEAQATLLNGESPNGNTLMDRKDFCVIVRTEGERLKLPIPATLKNNKLARIIMQQQKRAGIPMQRTGRINLTLSA